MAKTITLDDIRIDKWTVNLDQQVVHAEYSVLEDNGDTFARGDAYFWRVIPSPSNLEEEWNGIDELPDGWYQLPDDDVEFGTKTYVQVFAMLTVQIRSGLMHLVSE